MNAITRPSVFSAGILGTGILASLMMIVLVLAGFLGMGAGIFGLLTAEEAVLPIGLAMGVGAMAITGALIYYSIVLVACAKAWNGSRTWTIVLLVLSALGLFNPGIFSLPIQVLTIVGASMALGEGKRAGTTVDA